MKLNFVRLLLRNSGDSPCNASGKCLVTFECQTFLSDFPRQIWALMASTSRWDFEKQPFGFRKCAFVHFRLLFVLSVTLKVIGGFPDVGSPESQPMIQPSPHRRGDHLLTTPRSGSRREPPTLRNGRATERTTVWWYCGKVR